MKNILCAMSGGVDSSAAAVLLKREGYTVTGVTLRLSGNEADAEAAKAVCRIIGIEHITLDWRESFIDLVERPFCRAYLDGETPNPCVICNKRVKFGLLGEYAEANGFDAVATGHYVRKAEYNGHTVLRTAADAKKDQSYMLWQLSEGQLERSLFPLAELTKPKIRELAAEAGLPNADRHDSQDICFVPDGDYASFIKKLTATEPQPGDYLDTDGKIIGRHKGSLHYTVGQRKGLGVAFGEPVYVLSKDAKANTVTLGTDAGLYKTKLTVHSANLFAPAELPGRFGVKIRYAHTASQALVTDLGGGRLSIVFDSPQRAPAKGQSAVFYLGDLLAGGGLIE